MAPPPGDEAGLAVVDMALSVAALAWRMNGQTALDWLRTESMAGCMAGKSWGGVGRLLRRLPSLYLFFVLADVPPEIEVRGCLEVEMSQAGVGSGTGAGAGSGTRARGEERG